MAFFKKNFPSRPRHTPNPPQKNVFFLPASFHRFPGNIHRNSHPSLPASMPCNCRAGMFTSESQIFGVSPNSWRPPAFQKSANRGPTSRSPNSNLKKMHSDPLKTPSHMETWRNLIFLHVFRVLSQLHIAIAPREVINLPEGFRMVMTWKFLPRSKPQQTYQVSRQRRTAYERSLSPLLKKTLWYERILIQSKRKIQNCKNSKLWPSFQPLKKQNRTPLAPPVKPVLLSFSPDANVSS